MRFQLALLVSASLKLCFCREAGCNHRTLGMTGICLGLERVWVCENVILILLTFLPCFYCFKHKKIKLAYILFFSTAVGTSEPVVFMSSLRERFY